MDRAAIEHKLITLEKFYKNYNEARNLLFAALDEVSSDVKRFVPLNATPEEAHQLIKDSLLQLLYTEIVSE